MGTDDDRRLVSSLAILAMPPTWPKTALEARSPKKNKPKLCTEQIVQGLAAVRVTEEVKKHAVALKFANSNWTDPFNRIKLGPNVRV